MGFDYFYGTSGCPTCQPPYGFIENEHFIEPPSFYQTDYPFTGRPGMTAPGWDHKAADPTFAQKAVAYIEQRATSDQPFFLYLAFHEPHEPVASPGELVEGYLAVAKTQKTTIFLANFIMIKNLVLF